MGRIQSLFLQRQRRVKKSLSFINLIALINPQLYVSILDVGYRLGLYLYEIGYKPLALHVRKSRVFQRFNKFCIKIKTVLFEEIVNIQIQRG
jgi:hypothetical protein